jgi:2-polyprenyl-3-methyl-5-hydroxy-6-metoxy-1,4-benzoquinol methylase
MDELIKRFDAVPDRDLMLCRHRGVAWQKDMSHRVPYDAAYFDKCRSYEDKEIANRINAGRIALVNDHAGQRRVLDIGVGSGEFVRKRENTFGYDINPRAVEWLKKEARWSDDLGSFDAFTFWDVLEHVDVPDHYFRHMKDGSYLFTCLPIFADLDHIRESRHYRPGEHLYYFTEQGFANWMAEYRFRLLEVRYHETDAGRDSILSFAFVRDLPGYHDTVEQYRKLHSPAYGATAYLYFEEIARQVLALNPASVLDFGCGRSDLVAHFWADGRRRVARYDPAIPAYELMPEDRFDLVLCTDVMEHIQMREVGNILRSIRKKSHRALFTISLRPARAKLPDGRNAHVTLLTKSEWLRWIGDVFGRAQELPTQWDHILMVRTW